MKNRRQFTRILFSIKADLTIESKAYPVSIHDISLNGVLVSGIKPEQSFKDKVGTLTFCLSEGNAKITMQVTVVHEKDDEIGLQCNGIDLDSVTLLRRLIELNLGDNTQLDKELDQLSRSN